MCSPTLISKLCRLCSLEVEYGFDIFVESEVKASLVILINKYLPIKVTEDDVLPKQICERCHVGVAATVDLIDRMVQGQYYLKKLHQTILNKNLCSNIKINSRTVNKGQNRHRVKEDPDKEVSTVLALENQNFCHSNFESISHDINLKFLAENDPKSLETMLLDEAEISQKQASVPYEEGVPHTLINLQGDTPNIEMDDLAKGTEVKKVYESHPLRFIVEGQKPKRKRGRPRKDSKDLVIKPVLQKEPKDNDERRSKRTTNLPSRFRDTLAGKDFDKLLSNEECLGEEKDTEEPPLTPFKGDTLLPFSDFTFLNMKEKTHNLEGNTVVVTSNHQDEGLSKLPAAVSIELTFSDNHFTCDENGSTGNVHTPKASVSSIQELDLSKLPYPEASSGAMSKFFEKMLKPPKKRKGPMRKFKYFCEFCNKGFLQLGRYLSHMKFHKNVVLQCDECKSRFSNSEDINLHHQNTNHEGIGVIESECQENLSIKCPSCQDRTFLTLERYKAHVANMHQGQKPFNCLVCSKRFAYRHTLKNHYLSHQPDRPKKSYPCKECPKVFPHQSSLIYHHDSHHNAAVKFVCGLCGGSFKHKQLLQRHRLVHSGERPYSCKLCGSNFKTQGNLYNHMNVHNKNKRFACQICSKKFRHTTSLNLHLRSHTGEKPYGCTYCGKLFSQKGNLQEHTRIHTGVKPYCCSHCGKEFTTSSQRSLHEKRHKGEYKVKCPTCGKGFFNTDSLLIHERKHKGEKIFSCKQCPKTFNEKIQLTKHLKSHSVSEVRIKAEDSSVLKCPMCLKTFKDSFVFSKHMEGHQMEKSWLIGGQPSIAETNSPLSAAACNQDIIYVLANNKKEEPNFQFLSFEADEMFNNTEGEEQVPSPSVVTNNFIFPQNRASAVPVHSQMEVGEPSFEMTLKSEPSDPITFSIPDAEVHSIYVKTVFDS